ncbi:MAG TPA: trifunctional transcriptional regulator/proline dehydrogenase/L-glutamate gamma-semialdehyde dehydrogenase, partial [Brevundimonas sp.]|nr:trifunctional transcriptional regulator/proline dehydrogenase/L-glutamate gamma-semialdehyde dehydrogenase [Brevundimonas sp.]
LVCAKAMIEAAPVLYSQFASHNAHTLAAVRRMARDHGVTVEHQRLHGMGEALYDAAHEAWADETVIVRAYAPVGGHEELLPYLVRRLLENGANSSFVHALLDERVPASAVAADPISLVEQAPDRHPKIPVPKDMYGDRQNSLGRDYSQAADREAHAKALELVDREKLTSGPIIGGKLRAGLNAQDVTNPFDRSQVLGHVSEAEAADIDAAVHAAAEAQVRWDRQGGAKRAIVLRAMADALEADLDRLVALLSREAGKTLNDGVAEVREAADFCRYYALLAERDFTAPETLKGPTGETNQLLLHGRGVFACISPWNFPLAIFTGQIAAALAAGNAVLAKPAEQTPLIAAQAVRILLEAGVPAGVVQLLPGLGETVGAQLTGDERVRGVMFTGSTAVATLLQRNLAGRLDPQGRPTPLIAETGGMNAMIVDSSALTEQVVLDIVSSAYDSAGQRCSALRLLCIQDDVADHTLKMLRGAMAECRMGNPERLSTDIGPVIDAEAKENIERHIQAMRAKGLTVFQAVQENLQDSKEWQSGTFIMPTLIELNSIDELDKEVFGPVLHVVRFTRSALPQLIEQINASGYGLTLGVHTRIDETIAQVTQRAKVGNLYVNRNMVGAVVGVQPFGGEGLSGTGPKAGGPLYLYRLLSHRPDNALQVTLDRHDAERPLDATLRPSLLEAHRALSSWAKAKPALADLCARYEQLAQGGTVRLLPGPTGERNTYILLPRERVLCLADNEADALIQLAAVTSVGSRALWQDDELHRKLAQSLPEQVRARIDFARDPLAPEQHYDAVIYHGDADQLRLLCEKVAARDGAIVSVQGFARGETNLLLERLLIERALSVNTAAAGGNASLMTIG